MRQHSTTLTLAAVAAGLGLVATAPFAGCGGSDNTDTSSASGSGGGGVTSSSSSTGTDATSTSSGGQGKCGNGIKDGVTEECDDGNTVNGDGCNNDCTLTCGKGTMNGVTVCDDMDPCNGAEACDEASHTCKAGSPAADGTDCGMGKICKAGVCGDISCGDGFVSPPEECDDGNKTAGDGCENDCTFSCHPADPTACTPADPCQGKGTCDAAKHTCSAGVPLPDGTACGVGSTCKGGVCTMASCGNGMIDPGEQCEPPNTPTCDANCHTIAQVTCGNGVREGTEQCDDGNTTNLDGCDATCNFETDARVNWLKMQFATDAYCATNALGGAVTATGQSQLQMSLDTGISDGSISVLFKLLGLDDLTGTSDPTLQVGTLNGTPVMGAGYDGTNDLDWWYKVDPLSIDANRNPKTSLNASIAAKVLNAGPGALDLSIIFSGVPGVLKMSNAKVQGTIGTTSTPLASAGATPGHLAGEHLDPALMAIATLGQQNANGAAKLCGNVSASSLASIPVPAALQQGGGTACTANYTAANSLLDVFIGGCTVFIIQVIKPAQPDQVDPNAPVGGAGGPYKLTAGANHVVSGCTDKNNANVPLQTCLNAAAYSSYFKFTTDRVIIK